MSLLVDYREGSRDLIAPLKRAGLPAEESDIPADLAFVGRGEKGTSVMVGIEYKKLSELVQSLRTERLQGYQLMQMRGLGPNGEPPNFDFAYLFIEGEVRFDDMGRLLKRTGRRQFRPIHGGMGVGELFKRVNVLHLCGGLNPVWLHDRAMTLKAIEMLYRTWTDQDLDKHKSHLAVYQPAPLLPISPTRTMLCSLPGVKMKVSAAAERTFGSVRRAINADVGEWAALETLDDKGKSRKFGQSAAQRIVTAVTATR